MQSGRCGILITSTYALYLNSNTTNINLDSLSHYIKTDLYCFVKVQGKTIVQYGLFVKLYDEHRLLVT